VPDPERLWSPWRMEYILRGEGEDGGGCLFCDLAAAGRDQDEANHLLARGRLGFVLLNAFPYNPGHLMVAPYRHVGDFEELTADELAELMAFAGRAIRAMREESGPARSPGPASPTTCTCTWCRAGAATPTSCRWSARPRSCPSCWPRPTGGYVVISRSSNSYVLVSSSWR
jgi:hypothetical protein